MKKKLAILVAAALVATSLSACGNTASESETPAETVEPTETGEGEEAFVDMANPWRDATEEEARKYAPNGFSAPEGASNVRWSIMLPDNDPAREMESMVQLDFDLDGQAYTAREQMSGDTPEDITGMYYDWQSKDTVTLANWMGGMATDGATVMSYEDSEESARACIWYDIETGYSYSLGVSGHDLSNVDIQAVAEAIYDPAKQEWADIPDDDDAVTSALPPYEYPGPEVFYSVLYQYLIDEYAGQYEAADVTIPCPYIIAMDESDHEDIRVWGDFWLFNYNLNGTTLETVSGGSYPGCMHLSFVDDERGYIVTEMELAGDGSDFEPTAKKIFGDHYQELIDNGADTEGREATRAQIIANYVDVNELDITEYQDYGWDPVTLPEENIDNFYSILD